MPPTNATSGGIRAGRAFVELFADDSKLVRGLRRAQKRLQDFGSRVRNMGAQLAGLGAAVAVPLGAAAKLFSNTGDQLDKMAQRTGFSVEALSQLGFAAEQSGSDIQTLEAGVRGFQTVLRNAERGLSRARENLLSLGLAYEHFRGLAPEEQFKLVADRLAQIEDPSRRAGLAMQLLGGAGQKLLPLLSLGTEGMEDLQRQAHALGLTISKEDASAAAVFNDQLNVLWKTVQRGVFTVGSALAPVLTDLAERVRVVIKTTGEWIDRNRDLVVTVAKTAAALAAGGVALVGLGVAISSLGTVLGALATVVTGVGAAMGVLASATAALLTPVGLVTAAVVTLGAHLLHTTGVGAKALSQLGQRFDTLKEEATTALDGIRDALASGGGGIPLAARILWLTLKLEWQNGVHALQSAWLAFKKSFLDVAHGAFAGTLGAFQIASHGLEVAWIEAVSLLTKVWTSFTSGFRKAWNAAVNWTAKRLLDLKGLLDSDFDSGLAKRMADRELEATNRRIEQRRKAALAEAEQTRQERRQQTSQDHDRALAVIGHDFEDARLRLEDGFTDQRNESQRQLAEARRQFREAVEQARRQRQATEQGGDQDTTGFGNDRLKNLMGTLAGLDGTLRQAARRTVEVRGTFNAAAIQGLVAGGGGAAERTATAAEETARNTKKLLQEAQSGGSAFS